MRAPIILMAGLALLAAPTSAQQAQPVTRSVVFTDAEITETVELLDLACKSGGLRACQPALRIALRLLEARQPKPAAPMGGSTREAE